ncbi:phage-related protein [Clostridium beijerinckii]|uniref:hypothetical protein n=1 Tax=Clostridium beijerinckii TaxID=1520 RepID=UPI001494EE99|nr:hypothetical protein [Clostridium beijerinckii]NOW85306.1 phage-related protein [Clostridium beijerinckii]
MAESTGSGDSVGKITLDLEVTSDLANQISKVSNAMGKKLKDTMDNTTKGMFDGMNESMNKSMQSMSSSLKSGLDKMKQNIRGTFTSALDVLKNIKMPSISFPKIDISRPNTSSVASKTTTRGPPVDKEALTAQIDNATRELDIVNAKIEQQQAKLVRLKEQYSNTFNETRKNRLEEQILRTESAINGLINKSDKLGFKIADMDAKLARAGKGAGEAASKFNLLGKVTGAFGSLASGTANMSKKLGESLKSLGSSCKSTNNHMSNMHNGLGNIARQFATWMIILPLVMKGLEAMTSGLLADLKTNDQFNQSLNQIKTNLMVAFTPIFYAILPAINSLMSALATATTYIASFISAIFGKTYQQSYQATQGLIDAKNAMGAYGDSAKKAAKDALGLAGFDEINKLSKSDSGADNSKVPTLTQPSMDTSQVDSKMQALADKFKEILGKIFDPMVQAWNAEGKNTLDALKYALGSIWDLAKDIGSTFLDVWDNGTGVKVCTDILKLLQTVFNIIGDIATTFKTAWDSGDLGKQVVQAILDALDAILQLLNTIGQVFRDVWNSGIGVEICTNILEILKNIFTVIGQVADSFNKAFQSDVGKQLVTDILNLLNGCLKVIKDISSSFSKAWKSNGDTIAAGILKILDDIVGTISDIANNWATAWENNGNGDTLMQSLLSTLGKILTTIGDIGQGIRDSIGKASDTIFPAMIQFATDVSNGLGNLTTGFKAIWDNGGKVLFDGIVQLIAQVASLIMQLSSGVFVEFSNIFKAIAPVIGEVCGAIGTLIGWIAQFIGWINQCTPIIQIITPILGVLATAFGAIELAVKAVTIAISAWSTVCTVASTIGTGLGIVIGALTSPIGLVVVAITSLIAIGVALYQNWDVIKQKANECWTYVQRQFDDFKSWLDSVFSKDWSTQFGAFGVVINGFLQIVKDVGTGIGTALQGILDFIVGVFTGNWSQAWQGVQEIFKGVFEGLAGIAKAPLNAVLALINGLISGVNKAISALNKIHIDVPDWVPEIGGESFGFNLSPISKVPYLATGGIIDSPTLAMVGEAGKEAVMPLENNTGWIDDLAGKIAGKIGINNSSGSTQNSSGDVIFMFDSDVIGKIAIDQLRKAQRQGKITVIPI